MTSKTTMETIHGRFPPDEPNRQGKDSRTGVPPRIVADATPVPVSGLQSAPTPSPASWRNSTETSQQDSQHPSGAGRYVPLNELGRGGWGIVQRAHDRQLDREVAVKRILNAKQLRAGDVDQFLHEARITSGLQHPGVVPVHELVQDQSGDTYYVMKLLEGETLRQEIRKVHAEHGPSKWNRQDLVQTINPLLLRFIDVCNAIAYAHGRGIIHRDLKPSNVMVGAFGETIVVDWGLARYVDGDVTDPVTTFQGPQYHGARSGTPVRNEPTRGYATPRSSGPAESEGSVVGTPTYMAPEQARGELSSLGCHSDVYSLGVMLYEIVAGHHPYKGMDVKAVLDQARRGHFTPLFAAQPAAPKALVRIVHAAMAADPSARYRDVETLAEEVRRFMVGDRVSVHPETLVERGVRWCKRHRGIAATLAIAGLLLFAVTLISAIVIHRAHAAEQVARMQADRAHRETLHHLIDARETADTWLVDLSGALKFHPAMMPLRNELLSQARHQYQELVKQPIVPIGAIDLQASNVADATGTDALMWLEHARCHLRLGDLNRLCNDVASAERHYVAADDILSKLHRPNVTPRDVVFASGQPTSHWFRVKAGLEDLVQLERINVVTGHALATASPPSLSEIIRAREWIDARLPMMPNADESAEVSDYAGRMISTRIRFELTLLRTTDTVYRSTAGVFSEDRFRGATLWARWLARHRGRPSDLQLCETVLNENARHLEASGDQRAACQAWSELIGELTEWIAASPERSDWIASLAHARLARAQLAAALDRREVAVQDCVAAIDDLERSWSLTDADAFFRVNLATARFNLARLWSDGDEEQRDRARTLFADTIDIYRNLLEESATPDILRRLAQTHAASARSFSQRSDVAEPSSDQADHHLRNAVVAYQILQDQGFLNDQDRLDFCRVLINAADDDPESTNWREADRVLRSVDKEHLSDSLKETYRSLRKTLEDF